MLGGAMKLVWRFLCIDLVSGGLSKVGRLLWVADSRMIIAMDYARTSPTCSFELVARILWINTQVISSRLLTLGFNRYLNCNKGTEFMAGKYLLKGYSGCLDTVFFGGQSEIR